MTKADKQFYILLGQELRKARENKGLSLEAVAELVGLTKKTIQRYETAESRISTNNLKAIAKILEVDISKWIMFDDRENVNEYGDHQKHLAYFADKPELLDIYNEITQSENLRLLFDSARDLTPKQLESILVIIQSIKDAESKE